MSHQLLIGCRTMERRDGPLSQLASRRPSLRPKPKGATKALRNDAEIDLVRMCLGEDGVEVADQGDKTSAHQSCGHEGEADKTIKGCHAPLGKEDIHRPKVVSEGNHNLLAFPRRVIPLGLAFCSSFAFGSDLALAAIGSLPKADSLSRAGTLGIPLEAERLAGRRRRDARCRDVSNAIKRFCGKLLFSCYPVALEPLDRSTGPKKMRMLLRGQ